MLKTDLVYVWFCDYHAFWTVLLAKLFRKKSILVIGGYDAVVIPKIQYGLFYKNNIRSKLARWTFNQCDKIISVEEALIDGGNNYAPKGTITGLVNLIGERIKKKSVTIPTGYDSSFWKVGEKKKKQVLSVAFISNERTYFIKGMDLLLAVAEKMPSTDFVIIGVINLDLIPNKYRILENVTFYGKTPYADLVNYYAESKVYAQFSISEGLPNVLCEAMMSGCISVGANVNGIPKAIGDTGFILKTPNVDTAKKLVEKALESSQELGDAARNRMIRYYSLEKRKEKINHLIKGLLA